MFLINDECDGLVHNSEFLVQIQAILSPTQTVNTQQFKMGILFSRLWGLFNNEGMFILLCKRNLFIKEKVMLSFNF